MHHKPSGCRAGRPDPLGELERSPRPSSRIRGDGTPGGVGERGRERKGRNGMRMERKGGESPSRSVTDQTLYLKSTPWLYHITTLGKLFVGYICTSVNNKWRMILYWFTLGTKTTHLATSNGSLPPGNVICGMTA